MQAVLGKQTKGPRPQSSERYLLAGLVRCGACGYGMTQASTTTRGKEYRYHRCVTRDREGTDACPTQPVAAEELERIVIEHLRRAASRRDLSDSVRRKAEELAAKRSAELHAEREALPGAIAKLRLDAKRLVDAYADAKGAVRAELEGRLEEVTGQARAHELRLERIGRELAGLHEMKVEAEWVARTIANFGAVWDAMPPPHRARLVRALVERVVVDERAGKVGVQLREGGVGRGQEAA